MRRFRCEHCGHLVRFEAPSCPTCAAVHDLADPVGSPDPDPVHPTGAVIGKLAHVHPCVIAGRLDPPTE